VCRPGTALAEFAVMSQLAPSPPADTMHLCMEHAPRTVGILPPGVILRLAFPHRVQQDPEARVLPRDVAVLYQVKWRGSEMRRGRAAVTSLVRSQSRALSGRAF
jgi:hypothetical protein